MIEVATQWNSGATRDSNRGHRARIPAALTTRPLSHTNQWEWEELGILKAIVCADLFSFALVGALTLLVDSTEVGDDDRNRKCYDEYPTQRADATHDLADRRARHHVAITTDRQTFRLVLHPLRFVVQS